MNNLDNIQKVLQLNFVENQKLYKISEELKEKMDQESKKN